MLTRVPTAVLERLASEVRSGRLSVPLSSISLRAAGLGSAIEELTPVAALSADALLVLLDAVLAERRQQAVAPELVWTGPDAPSSLARDTAVVVRQLFLDACETVLVAGFAFDHGERLLAPLHAAMKDRQVRCRIFAEAKDVDSLSKHNWPFGPPFPWLFAFVPPEGQFASLHAKCVVVDHRRVFITSANFTDRGHTRNIEAGVLLDDPVLAATLEAQFEAAISAGSFIAA
jgi:hypothetical protein